MNISIGSDSMMAQNFFDAGSEQSRYIKAKHIAARSDVSLMASRQNAILSVGMAACASSKSMAELIREGKKAARQVEFDMQQSVSEISERNLKELKRRHGEQTQKGDDEQANSTADASQVEARSAAASGATATSTASTPSESVAPVATSAQMSSTANVQPVRQNISILV